MNQENTEQNKTSDKVWEDIVEAINAHTTPEIEEFRTHIRNRLQSTRKNRK